MEKTKYIETVGRRKTSVINDKDLNVYFPTQTLQNTVTSVFKDIPEKFSVTAMVKGGGISSQSEAVRHGIARAIVEHDSLLRTQLKTKGFLKRDPRAKERRKFGLKKARKAPQWSKR
jgi:small subunit ribosomal protein S9